MSDYEFVSRGALKLKTDTTFKKKKKKKKSDKEVTKILEQVSKVSSCTDADATSSEKAKHVPLTNAERAYMMMKEKRSQVENCDFDLEDQVDDLPESSGMEMSSLTYSMINMQLDYQADETTPLPPTALRSSLMQECDLQELHVRELLNDMKKLKTLSNEMAIRFKRLDELRLREIEHQRRRSEFYRSLRFS